VNDPESTLVAMPYVVPPRRGRPPNVPKALVSDDEVIKAPEKNIQAKKHAH
jgi:hypothetical protein